jgi:regulator of protease activity HflC (stomatin/prohibitin superfamily)
MLNISFLLTNAQVFGIIALAFLVLVILVTIIRSIKIVRQATVIVVERLGKFNRICQAGMHFVIPFFERATQPIFLKERVSDFPPQPVITKDNVTMSIDTVVYWQVTDPKLFVYGVIMPQSALENLTATTLRNLIGDLELDETLTSRDTVNHQMWKVLDLATDPWGIKVTRVELKNILPPRDIQEAMEKQMRAERQKRQEILEAEGKKAAAILIAEGEKEAVILRSEAAKQKMIREAEGEAEALLAVYEANAKGISLVNAANPGPAYLTLKGFEALENLANGQSTKIIVPSEIQNVTGLLTSLKEAVIDDKPHSKK